MRISIVYQVSRNFAKADKLSLSLGTNGVKVTSEPPPTTGQPGCSRGHDRSAILHASTTNGRAAGLLARTRSLSDPPCKHHQRPGGRDAREDMIAQRSSISRKFPELRLLTKHSVTVQTRFHPKSNTSRYDKVIQFSSKNLCQLKRGHVTLTMADSTKLCYGATLCGLILLQFFRLIVSF
ncbi:hypothetical protein J6590_089703 [Homalodisca vitripennis]|nr:hypothetical protein J6590_089703 [Homalodisca vitripennis]